MRGGELIREARRRAGLSQRELAARLGTSQAVIARWETGRRSPAWQAVTDAVRTCGLDLAVSLVAYDDDHDRLIDDMLAHTPEERLERMLRSLGALRHLRQDAERVDRPA